MSAPDSGPAPGLEAAQAAQVDRLARRLGVEPDELPDLGSVSAADLRTLHEQVGRSIFAGSEQRLTRIAGLSSALPGPVAARLAEKFLPPSIAARVAELLETARAADLVRRLSVPYLASVAAALDPERSRHVVQTISPERIGAVVRELLERHEHDVLAHLTGAVTPEQLAVVRGELDEPHREAVRAHLPAELAGLLDASPDPA